MLVSGGRKMLAVMVEQLGHAVLNIYECGTDVDPVKIIGYPVEEIFKLAHIYVVLCKIANNTQKNKPGGGRHETKQKINKISIINYCFSIFYIYLQKQDKTYLICLNGGILSTL